MPVALSRAHKTLAACLVASCSAAAHWPSWAVRLAERLECGMEIAEIRELTEREVHRASGLGRLERYFITTKGRSRDLWLHLGDGGLESIAVSEVAGLTATRLSPVRNLCTGETQFFVRVTLSEDLADATLYLDGERIDAGGDLWPHRLVVNAGEHHLRVEKHGHEPGSLALVYGPDDRGDPSIYLRACPAAGGPRIHVVEAYGDEAGAIFGPGWCGSPAQS